MRVCLHHNKRVQISSLANRIRTTPWVTPLDLMGLLGKFNFASMAVLLGRPHSRPLQLALPKISRDQRSLNTRVYLSDEAKDSLVWWGSPPRSRRSLLHPLPDRVLTTDASMSGWGAQMGPLSIQGVRNLREQQEHMNYRELMTVFHALTRWKEIMSHQGGLPPVRGGYPVDFIVPTGC